MSTTIYHNPRCSKSRKTLEILQSTGMDIDVIEYLQNPPSKTELKSILAKLNIGVRELMRTKEAIYAELNLADGNLSDDDLLEAMITHPILIERPIVVSGEKAVIGRPPENVETLL